MGEEIIIYKGLEFQINKQLNYLELFVDDKNFIDSESYIIPISIMVEYAVYIRPEYLIINKLNSDFKLAKELFGFTINRIFQQLKDIGIKRVLMIVNEDSYNNHYHNIEKIEPYMQGFKSKEDSEQWILERKALEGQD